MQEQPLHRRYKGMNSQNKGSYGRTKHNLRSCKAVTTYKTKLNVCIKMLEAVAQPRLHDYESWRIKETAQRLNLLFQEEHKFYLNIGQ